VVSGYGTPAQKLSACLNAFDRQSAKKTCLFHKDLCIKQQAHEDDGECGTLSWIFLSVDMNLGAQLYY
jgi:hypothetical protein